MADGSAPKPYTEEDVQLVARWFREERYRDPEYNARDVLDALAEAGRLLPEGAQITEEWGALERVPGGCNFTVLADDLENAEVDREQWAREFAAEVGGEVQRRTVTYAESDWLTVDAERPEGSDG